VLAGWLLLLLMMMMVVLHAAVATSTGCLRLPFGGTQGVTGTTHLGTHPS
jgi:hypothetical protein